MIRHSRNCFRTLALGLVVLAAVSGAACSGPDAPVEAAWDDNEPLVVVSGADLTSQEGVGTRQQLIDDWNELHPKREVSLVELPLAEDGQLSDLIASLQSGTADYDVLNLDTTWIPAFAEADLIRPLDDALVEGVNFLPEAVEAGRWEDGTYAVPFNTDVGLLYYREDLLTAQDHTREDLTEAVSMAELIGGWETGQDHSALVTQLRPYEGLAVNILETFWSAEGGGVDVVDDDGDYTGSIEELTVGLDALRSIADSGVLSPVSYEADESTALAEFIDEDGGTALMRGWPYALNRLPTNGEYGVATLPGEAVLGGQSLAVSADSDRQADAEELIRFLTRDVDNQRRLFDGGFAPALRDAYDLSDPDDPGCASTAVRIPARNEDEVAARSEGPTEFERDYHELLWCALRDAEPRPATEYYPVFSETLRDEVSRMLDEPGEQSVEDTAEELHRRLPDALEGRLSPDDTE
ncbi:extracellular solute-binding protein [Streptomyces sp. B6B3]|uniref:extracellular solute-binding protein n=1 Tax=Streptomyces sp. B6B3 TaxID=3153570 RepID=UPI00325E5853